MAVDVIPHQGEAWMPGGIDGEGPADDEALVQLMATIRQHLADSESPVPPE